MAIVLKSFIFRGRSARYPWEKWLDGRIWQLKRGEDFAVSIPGFLGSAHPAARKRKLLLRTSSVDENTVVIQAISPDGR